MTKADAAIILPSFNISHNDYCYINLAKDKNIVCDSNAKYSRIDGKCNNIVHPLLGSSIHCHRRLLPPDYGDGIKTFRRSFNNGKPLPNERILSVKLLPNVTIKDTILSLMHVEWGQILSHDFSRTTVYFSNALIQCCPPYKPHPECFALKVPSDGLIKGLPLKQCLSFIRTLSCNTCKFGIKYNTIIKHFINVLFFKDHGIK
jgi:hypothetical protein